MNDIEKILKQLVALRSFVPYEHEPFGFLISILSKYGFSIEKQRVEKNRYNLLGKKGNAKQSILIYMHLDTVHPASGWEVNPLILKEAGNNYIGLGCFDMKGGIAAVLSILSELSLKKHSLKLVFGIDEEGISEGVYKLVDSSFLDDVVVAFCPEACIVPPSWKLPLMITIGGRGRCVLSVSIPGKTTHGAEDTYGINAIDQAAIIIQNLGKFKNRNDRWMGESSFFVRSIRGGNEELSIPDVAEFEIDFQLVFGQTPEKILEEMTLFIASLYEKNILEKSLINQYKVALKTRKTPYIRPYSIDRKNKYVQLVNKLAKDNYKNSSFDYAKSVADQNVIGNKGIPIITIGPIGGNAHQANEWVSKASLSEVSSFYLRLLSFF